MALGPLYIHEEGVGTGRGGRQQRHRNRQLEQVTGKQDKYNFGQQIISCAVSSYMHVRDHLISSQRAVWVWNEVLHKPQKYSRMSDTGELVLFSLSSKAVHDVIAKLSRNQCSQ